MHRLRRSVPSLTALLAFEAAARRENFTRAAEELGVSQAAVSRRIKALEAEIGAPLFERVNRAARLTPAGRLLFAGVGSAFDTLAQSVDAIRAPRAELTVAVSVAFGHFRLLPALSSFRAAAPGIGLRVLSEDAWNAPRDSRIDVAVRYGRPPFAGMTVVGALAERVVPVCAPTLRGRLGARAIPDLLADPETTLIESDAPEPSWLDWSEWLRRGGWPPGPDRPRLRFSSYSDAAYAAMAGEGLTLGWVSVLQRPLADGRLVTLDVPALLPEEKHYILVPQHRAPSARLDTLIAWMEMALGPETARAPTDGDPPD